MSCRIGLNAITREACNTAQDTEDKREKIQALALAKECYSMKLDLLTNATVVDDAIRFVSNYNKDDNSDNEKQKHISNHQAKEKEQESTTAENLDITDKVFE
jgi:hypothetical protein